MFASICRRRLALRIHQIAGGGGGTNLLEFIPGTIPLAHCYTSPAVAEVPSSEPCPDTVSYLISAPVILVADPERILRPKLDFFASLGFETHKLATEPLLLARSLDKHLVPAIQFLRGIIGSDDDLRRAFHRVPRGLAVDLDNNMRPAVEALRRGGLTEADISKLLVIRLGVLLSSPDRISEIFEELKAMGMSVLDPRFLYCFRAMSGVKRDSWLRKMAFYQSFGLSEGELLQAFKTQPTIFLFTDESIKKKAFKTQPTIFLFTDESIKKKGRVLLDELKLGISDVIARPVVLGYSLEKCILPRNFETRYVLRHADDVPDVVKAYQGKIKFEGFK
uniref:mTERF domain-containing protein 1, mitochondrial n=1 Tax=Aegilops tauschii TaxID=37682 RepID=N1QT23_AEGTA